MSTSENEQRIQSLEMAVFQLQSSLGLPQAGRSNIGDDEVEGEGEYPLIPGVPPKESKRFRAHVSVLRSGRRDLGLSKAEWTSLGLEEDDD